MSLYAGHTTLRMRQLPKSEYTLMKRLIEHFDLDDPSELYGVLLVLGYEVLQRTDLQGKQWVTRIIGELREDRNGVRDYELFNK